MTPKVSLLAPATRARLDMLQRYFEAHGLSDPQAAQHEAVMLVGRTIELQASYLAYGDAFALLGTGMVLATVAALLLRKPQGSAPPGGH
jgi:DHA2 family multidrug resistance protein